MVDSRETPYKLVSDPDDDMEDLAKILQQVKIDNKGKVTQTREFLAEELNRYDIDESKRTELKNLADLVDSSLEKNKAEIIKIMKNRDLCYRFFRGVTKTTEGDIEGFTGRISKYHQNEKERGCSTKPNDIRQLRYLSYKFYFNFKRRGLTGKYDIKEVQIMKVEVEGKDIEYYVATNHNEELITVKNRQVSTVAAEMITTMTKNNETMGKLMGAFPHNIRNEPWLRKKQEKLRKTLPKFKSANNSTLLCDWAGQEEKDDKRHAEEFLCDIAQNLRGKKKTYTFTIYGKKRPCLTCVARMKFLGIDHFNQHHGRMFMHAVKYMSDEVAFDAVKLLIDGPSYVTMCDGKVITDYDTDSEDEEPPEFNYSCIL